ncbi:phosphoribosylamine--glycine ligase N-terminal domain-containing protein, partial [Saccharothrix sp. ST-888]|uniref:phosphoribosylamine--glycine ligase N-terminal domain-containing protein n=1 Tax=Saccharothrix sp. ST-888 TaxID=1427391 RepID=UPI0022B0B0C3
MLPTGPARASNQPPTTLAGLKVIVIGGRAREPALCRSLSQDPAITGLHCAPGNAGSAQVATVHPVDQLDGAEV